MEKVHNYLKEKSRKTFGVAVIALIIFYVIWFIAWVSPDVPLFIVMVCFAICIVSFVTTILCLIDSLFLKLLCRAVNRSGIEETIDSISKNNTKYWFYCFNKNYLNSECKGFQNAKVIKYRRLTFLYDFEQI